MLYLTLAEGFEETEAIASLDVIRRAKLDIKTVGVGGEYITGAHGVTVKADITADEIDKDAAEGVVLPGGMPGTLNLQKSAQVKELIEHCAANGKLIAAICAAPMIIGDMGLLDGRRAVCFPGYEENLVGAIEADDYVVIDGNYITARGGGVTLEFGAAIVNYISKSDAGNKVLRQMQKR